MRSVRAMTCDIGNASMIVTTLTLATGVTLAPSGRFSSRTKRCVRS